MPDIWEWLTYGPGAPIAERKRLETEQRRQMARDLLELQAVSRTPSSPLESETGLNLDLPRATFSPANRADLTLALADVGLNEGALTDAREQEARTATYLDVAEAIKRGDLSGKTLALGDLANKKKVAPVEVDGGVAFNRYATEQPITGQSPDVTALARKREAEAAAEEARLAALQDVLAAPDVNPVLKADVANKRAIGKPQRVKVRRQDGSEVYMDARPNLQGGWDYSPATDGQSPLRVPVSGGDGRTALQKDTQFIADTLNIQPEKALLFKLQSKGKSDKALWEEIVLRVQSSQKWADTDEVQQRASELWSIVRPESPIPAEAGALPEAPRQAETQGTWNGQTYAVGQIIDTPGGRVRVTGFYPDGEPSVEWVR